MKAALYHRVSTSDQDPELARDELRAAAARMGAEIVLDIEETGSGARNNRPGWQKVMTAAVKRKVDVVLVWKLDRAGRSTMDLMTNVKQLTDAGVRLVSVTQGLAFDGSAIGKMLGTMLAAVAEFERDLIVERTRMGVAKARAAGKHLGRPRSTVDVQRARELRSEGKTWAEIGEVLDCSEGTARRSCGTLPGWQSAA